MLLDNPDLPPRDPARQAESAVRSMAGAMRPAFAYYDAHFPKDPDDPPPLSLFAPPVDQSETCWSRRK